MSGSLLLGPIAITGPGCSSPMDLLGGDCPGSVGYSFVGPTESFMPFGDISDLVWIGGDTHA